MTFDALVCVWRTILCQWDQESSIIDPAVDQAQAPASHSGRRRHDHRSSGGSSTGTGFSSWPTRITDQKWWRLSAATASHHGRSGRSILQRIADPALQFSEEGREAIRTVLGRICQLDSSLHDILATWSFESLEEASRNP